MPNFWRVPVPGEQSNPGSRQYIYRFPDSRTVFWSNPESRKYPSGPSTNAASDWCGAGSVDYLALETSIKPGMLCLRAPQIWSYVICVCKLQLLWTDLSRVCGKVYEISKVYWELEQWRLGKTTLIRNDGVRIPGGALGYFLDGYVPPGTPNWHPVLEKISPKIDTPL